MKLGNLEVDEILDTLRDHPFLFAFGIYVGIAIGQWLEYFFGYIPLENAAFFTILSPIVLIGVYLIKQTEHKMTFEKLVLVIGGGLALGWPIWVSLNYLLYVPMWAPFNDSKSPLSKLAFVLATVLSYGTAAYSMQRLDKRNTEAPEDRPLDEENVPPVF